MPTDPIRRSAARTATFVAVPVVVAFVLVSALMFGGFGTDTPPPPTPQATGPVTMDAPALAADVVPVCQQVVSHLPETVAGYARRPVTAGPEQNAAYGDPPITVACGTAQAAFPPTDEVYLLSGVCWHPVTGDNVTTWTTVDRAVPVTVIVPGPSSGSAQSVVPFSAAVGASVPPRDAAAVPAGCTG